MSIKAAPANEARHCKQIEICSFITINAGYIRNWDLTLYYGNPLMIFHLLLGILRLFGYTEETS